MSDVVRYERDGGVAVITLSRPEVKNALNSDVFAGLDEAMAQFVADDSAVAVLTGADGTFCAGADLGEFIPRLLEEGLDLLIDDPRERFFSTIEKPIVAAVEGHCIAGGMELLLGTDIRVAGESALFGLGETRWGVVPAGGSHVRLPRQVPWAVAMQMLLTARPIDARRAYDVGLISEIVADGGALDRALEIANVIAGNAPLAVRAAKRIAVRALDLEPAFELEYELAEPVFRTEDAKEGPRAFIEKRRPEYRGR